MQSSVMNLFHSKFCNEIFYRYQHQQNLRHLIKKIIKKKPFLSFFYYTIKILKYKTNKWHIKISLLNIFVKECDPNVFVNVVLKKLLQTTFFHVNIKN